MQKQHTTKQQITYTYTQCVTEKNN